MLKTVIMIMRYRQMEKMWALSNNDSIRGSRIYNLPIEGGLPNLITKAGFSYWNDWSLDG